MALRHVPYRPIRLGQSQLPPSSVQVSVVDRQGRPVQDAQVSLFGNSPVAEAKGATDSKGDALLNVGSAVGPYNVSVSYQGHTFWQEASTKQIARSETIMFELPFCVQDAILKPIDLGLLAAAGALAGSGVYFKIQPLTTAGEVVFGAAMFSIIYRLSCL